MNNDSLSDAVDARHVFISEADKTMTINEATFRSLVSAEAQHLKRMYKAEKSCKPNSKYTFAVNDLPQWKDADAYHTRRRNVYILLQKKYVNLALPDDRRMLRLEMRSKLQRTRRQSPQGRQGNAIFQPDVQTARQSSME